MKRFEIVVERRVIIYAETSRAAIHRLRADGIEVLDIVELGPIEAEAHGPSIDRNPDRATRR